MSDINLRIKFLVDKFSDGNNTDFGKLVNTSEANIRNYIKGTSPKSDFLEILCDKFEINAEWLLMGKGDWRKDSSDFIEKCEIHSEKENNENKIKNKPHDEQMQMLYNEIIQLRSDRAEDRLEIDSLRDQIDEFSLTMEISIAPILRHFKLKIDERKSKEKNSSVN